MRNMTYLNMWEIDVSDIHLYVMVDLLADLGLINSCLRSNIKEAIDSIGFIMSDYKKLEKYK